MHRIKIVEADITTISCDAIVNAAEESLGGGGGVDGAIHAAAGPELVNSSRLMAPCPAGEVRVTPGFKLPARYVLHAVGPRYSGGTQREEQALRDCYRKAMHLAVGLDLKSLAFPAISCGAFGYPLEAACNVAISEIARFLAQYDPQISVIMVAFDEATRRALEKAHPRARPGA